MTKLTLSRIAPNPLAKAQTGAEAGGGSSDLKCSETRAECDRAVNECMFSCVFG